MHFLPASRTKRNLIKIASLGLAGLLAGLLSGCNDSPNRTDASVNAPARIAGDSLTPDAGLQPAHLPNSIEATQIPALRHPPSTRRLQLGSVRTVSQTFTPYGRNPS